MDYLNENHRQYLIDRVVDLEVVDEGGAFSINEPNDLKECGFKGFEQSKLVPALALPWWSLLDPKECHHVQIRPDKPRKKNLPGVKSKVLKFEVPKGSTLCLGTHPRVTSENLDDPKRVLVLTEGIVKAWSAISQGLDALAVQGVTCWKVDGVVLPDFDRLDLRKKKVVLAFDGDYETNPNVRGQLRELGKFLRYRGAEVLVAPFRADDGQPIGIDDWFALGHSADDLMAKVMPLDDALNAAVALTSTKLSELGGIEAIAYVAEPYVPRGVLTLLDGPPGVGKSTWLTTLAAAISSGGTFPSIPGGDDAGGADSLALQPVQKGVVAYLTDEDDPKKVLLPRLLAAGGNPAAVEIASGLLKLSKYGRSLLDLSDGGFERLRELLDRVEPDLLVIDPLMTYLGPKVDPYKANALAPLIAPLNELAEAYDCAIVAIRHHTKKVESAIGAGTGGIAAIGTARNGLQVTRLPDRDDLLVLSHFKANGARKGPHMPFRIVSTTVQGENEVGESISVSISAVEWCLEEAVAATVDQLAQGKLAGDDANTKLEAACCSVVDVLADGPVPYKELRTALEADGFTSSTIKRAGKELEKQKKILRSQGIWKLTPKD